MSIQNAAIRILTGEASSDDASACADAVLLLSSVCDDADGGYGQQTISTRQLRKFLERGSTEGTSALDVNARYQAIQNSLTSIDAKLTLISEREDTVSADLDQLNALVAQDAALEASLEATLAKNADELVALHDAVSPNLQPAIASILARQTKVQSAISALSAADAANQPPPTVIPPAPSPVPTPPGPLPGPAGSASPPASPPPTATPTPPVDAPTGTGTPVSPSAPAAPAPGTGVSPAPAPGAVAGNMTPSAGGDGTGAIGGVTGGVATAADSVGRPFRRYSEAAAQCRRLFLFCEENMAIEKSGTGVLLARCDGAGCMKTFTLGDSKGIDKLRKAARTAGWSCSNPPKGTVGNERCPEHRRAPFASRPPGARTPVATL